MKKGTSVILFNNKIHKKRKEHTASVTCSHALPTPAQSRAPTQTLAVRAPRDVTSAVSAPAVISDVAISGSLRPPVAAQASSLAGARSMESVGAGGGAEAGDAVRVGASAPPGCCRAWPPPPRRAEGAGPPCAGSVRAAGRRPAAPRGSWVSVAPRPPLVPGSRAGGPLPAQPQARSGSPPLQLGPPAAGAPHRPW